MVRKTRFLNIDLILCKSFAQNVNMKYQAWPTQCCIGSSPCLHYQLHFPFSVGLHILTTFSEDDGPPTLVSSKDRLIHASEVSFKAVRGPASAGTYLSGRTCQLLQKVS
jgi:hypothetical protein